MELHEVTNEELLLELIRRLNMDYGDVFFTVDGGRPGHLKAVHKTLTIHRRRRRNGDAPDTAADPPPDLTAPSIYNPDALGDPEACAPGSTPTLFPLDDVPHHHSSKR